MQQLEANEKPLAKIFCGDYDFRVPNYQRPYAWGTAEAAELLDDLTGALKRDQDEPYFLGSLVLIKQSGAPESEIIDGQQRLTTLTILFAVLAELAGAGEAETQFRGLILEPGSLLLGLAAKPRLELRPKDAAFFRKYIQTAGQLEHLLALSAGELTNDSQVAIQANARCIHEKLSEWSPEQRLELGQLLAQRTYLVVVNTPDLASAHRIFSVMNARGLDLSPADVFKSDVIGAIPEDLRETYARKWEDAEEDLGRSEFADLFLHIRMIFDKHRARSELLKEFPEQVLARFTPDRMESFVDDELVPFSRAYCEIRDANFAANESDSEEVNAWFRRLALLDNNDWKPAALWAVRHHRGDPQFLSQFLARLERLSASMFIRRVYTTPRVERHARLLADLGNGAGLGASAFDLNDVEAADTIAYLDGDLYLNTRVRKYVLLRLDELTSAPDGPIFQRKVITIEHVLPQKPLPGSEWRVNFTDDQRAQWTHRLANLVLLNQFKNSTAANYEFEVKKKSYFTGKSGVTTFAITAEVRDTPAWTPAVLQDRQKKLLNRLIRAWQLSTTT